MKAVSILNPGPESTLVIEEHPMPAPSEGELLVQVHATALNRADLFQRSGRYAPPEGTSDIPGLEMAGVIADIGPGCRGWAAGERVCALLPGGGYAQYVVVPEDMAIRMPDAMSFEEAAAIPEVFLTAYQALFWLGRLKPGERVLIHAGASGVGTAAIQMARLTGASVYVTASAAKHDVCRTLGAHETIDYNTESFSERITSITGGEGVDLVIDFIGAPYFLDNIDVLGMDGRLVMLALMGGFELDTFKLNKLFRKRLHLKASTLRNRALSYKIKLTRVFVREMFSMFGDGLLKPVIDSVYAWEDVEEAQAYMAANKNRGKIVLRVE